MEITATITAVIIGEDVTITCSVLRGNSASYSFSIVHNDSVISSNSILLLINIQLADLGTYRCDVTNDAGTGNDSVTILQGGKIQLRMF